MAAGLDPDALWTKTPYEVSIIFEGRKEALSREHNDRAWLAWHIAALPRVKKVPALDKMLVKPARSPARRKVQSEAQMLSIARMMAGMSFPEANRGKAN